MVSQVSTQFLATPLAIQLKRRTRPVERPIPDTAVGSGRSACCPSQALQLRLTTAERTRFPGNRSRFPLAQCQAATAVPTIGDADQT